MSGRLGIFKGRIVDLGLETTTLPDGRTVELEILRHPGAAAVVPVHDDGTVTLIRQWRHAAGGMIWEVPAGVLDGEELPQWAARRELAEEVGLEAGRLTLLTVLHTTPGFTDERIWIYLAQDLVDVGARPEADEFIEVHRVRLEEAVGWVEAGTVADGKTVVGLLLASRLLGPRSP